MPNTVDYHDYTSILAEANGLSRKLEPIIRDELPALLGRRKPSGLARVADAAGQRRLHRRGTARQMLPVIVDACSTAIEDGTGIAGEWREVGWSDGGVDWEWHETTTHTEEAQQGAYVARVIRARLGGKPAPAPFAYRHLGNLATVGRSAAVIDFGRFRLTGWPAWWIWGIAHIYFLIGARSRITVAISWLWSFLMGSRSARLITQKETLRAEASDRDAPRDSPAAAAE